MKIYNNPNGIRRAIAEVLKIGIEEVELAYTGDGFAIVRPEGAAPDPDAVANWMPPAIEPEPIAMPTKIDEAAPIEAKLAATKSGTQAEKIVALHDAVEGLTAALKARGIL